MTRALTVLRERRRVRENYHMIDDELQLPVLLAQWMGNADVPASRKRAFLRDTDGGDEPRLTRVLRELALVARMTAPYAAAPSAATLISFPPRDEGGWASASWRDSGAGYAGGRFAMDVNAIWAPHALQAMRVILDALPALGFSVDSLDPRPSRGVGRHAARRVGARQRGATVWRWKPGWGRGGTSSCASRQLRCNATSRRASPRSRRPKALTGAPWPQRTGAERDSLTFLALALDANGCADRRGEQRRGDAPLPRRPARGGHRRRGGPARHSAVCPPVSGRDLFVSKVGPVVANDAFATDSVWATFARDPYHGPRVVWGREVNLFLLGLARQVALRGDANTPFARELRAAAAQVRGAVEASGFRSELWSYDFIGGVPTAVRYGSGGDVQLWSTTDLAVQFALAKLRW